MSWGLRGERTAGGMQCAFTIVLVVVGCAVGESRGQGMLGLIPAPISSADLMHYAQRLNLSDAQWPVVEEAHDEYKRLYREFQTGPMAEVMKQYGAIGDQLDRETIRKQQQQEVKLYEKAGVLDRRFFDQCQTVLSEEQLPSFLRVRLARERNRYRGNLVMQLSGRSAPEVGEVFFAMDLAALERDRADPLLVQYEHRLTTELREIHKQAADAVVDLYMSISDMQVAAAADAAGAGEGVDREQMRQRVEQLYLAALGEVIEKAAELDEFDRQTVRRIEGVLSPEIGPRFRKQYYRAVYSQLDRLLLNTHRWSSTLQELERLDDATLQRVDTIAIAHDARAAPLIDQYVLVQDEMNAAQSWLGALTDPDPRLQERQHEHYLDLVELNRIALEALGDQLGAALASRLISVTDERAERMIDAMANVDAVPDAEAAARAENARLERWSGDSFVSARLARSEVITLAETLGLDDEQRAVLDTLYDDYAAGYREIHQRDVVPIRDLHADLWIRDQSSGEFIGANEDNLPKITAARRRASVAMLELDEAFFEQLAAVFSPGEETTGLLHRVRDLRFRDSYAPGYAARFTSGIGYVAPVIDLLAVLHEHDYFELSEPELNEVFGDYGVESLELLKTRFQSAIIVSEADTRLSIEYQFRSGKGAGVAEYQELFKRWMADPKARFVAASRAIRDLNQATLKRVETSLDSAVAASILAAYRRAAHPKAYDDPNAMHERFLAVHALKDLSADHRLELDQEAIEYREQYESCCIRLVALLKDQQAMNLSNLSIGGGSKEAQALTQRFLELRREETRVRFERDELNTRAIRTLRSMLDADQIRRVGGLPEPKEGRR